MLKRVEASRSISLRNAQRRLPLDVAALQAFAEAAWEEALLSTQRPVAKLAALPELHVVLVSDRRMAALHKRFMGIDGPTDVITFQHGEIVVSVETAAAQALDHHSSLGAELRLYIVHGILHLLGFDDTTRSAARAMERRQRKILAAVNARG